jgi:hypothetical protein
MSDTAYPKLETGKGADKPASDAKPAAAEKPAAVVAAASSPAPAGNSAGPSSPGPARQRKIHPSRFKQAEAVRNVWFAVLEEGTKFEEILDPAYWAHNAAKLRIGDRIEVAPDDGSFFAELIVRAQGNQFAKVALLRKVDLEPTTETSALDGFEVQWKGQQRKHCVVRLRDKQVVSEGFDTKTAAFAWLGQNAKSLAA